VTRQASVISQTPRVRLVREDGHTKVLVKELNAMKPGKSLNAALCLHSLSHPEKSGFQLDALIDTDTGRNTVT